jgi:hypothetical protein
MAKIKLTGKTGSGNTIRIELTPEQLAQLKKAGFKIPKGEGVYLDMWRPDELVKLGINPVMGIIKKS